MRISTHILDLVRGRPAANVPVRLEKQSASGEWLSLASARTDADGRCTQLLPAGTELLPAIYRLIFDTQSYYESHDASQNVAALYPFVEVAFRVKAGESHFHIPLLLSPNGYTTYRGT